MDIYAFSNIQVCKSTMQQFKTAPALEHKHIMITSLHIHKMAQTCENVDVNTELHKSICKMVSQHCELCI